MSETVKLIIEIPKRDYEEIKGLGVFTFLSAEYYVKLILNGIPLNDVKKEIETNLSWDMFDEYGNETRLHKELMEILDNIDKGDKE